MLDLAPAGARLVFSCDRHITRDGKDVYALELRAFVAVFGVLAGPARFADPRDRAEACCRVFVGYTCWTVVRGSGPEEGESRGPPAWSRHVGDPVLADDITRRVDFALFRAEAITDDEPVHEAPAIVGCRTPVARAHAGRP
ncbi:hypothetical protein [Streptomyces hirsutus]|uniref:hypothetical protein n=1 Tax=Streptomyces hirsutus TaxID=35620 RepID=UPI001980909D|nr:hypothetical protein [Streptomyces hirsutus]